MSKPKATILIAEVDSRHLQKAGEIFTYAGYDVVRTPELKDVFGMAKSIKIDFIIMDIDSPRPSTAELIGELKSSDKTSHIPVIAFSESDTPDVRKKAEQAGCCGFLKNGFTPFEAEEEFKRVTGIKLL